MSENHGAEALDRTDLIGVAGVAGGSVKMSPDARRRRRTLLAGPFDRKFFGRLDGHWGLARTEDGRHETDGRRRAKASGE